MERRAVLIVKAREDPVITELAARLQASDRFALYSGRAWLDRDLEAHLAKKQPLGFPLALLMCSAARNEVLSRSLLVHDPGLLVVRIDIDTDAGSAGANAEAVNVDLVQHFRLDPQRLGFEHLLATLQYLVEHHGAGAPDRLARFLVLADPASRDGPGVRFLQVGGADSERIADRKLPPPAMNWLNAALREHVTRNPSVDEEQGALVMGRQRALALLDALDAAALRTSARTPSEPLRSAERELAEYLSDSETQLEPLPLLRRRLGLTLDDLQTLILCLASEVDLAYQLIFGHIQDDMTRRFATAALVDVVRAGHGSATAAASISALLALRLLAADGQHAPAADQPLRVDSALVQWLFVGGDALLTDAMVKSVTLVESWRGREFLTEAGDNEDRATLRDQLVITRPESYWTALTGADVEGWRGLLELAVIDAKGGILRVSLARFAALDIPAREDAAIRVARAGRLMSWHTVIDCAGESIDAAALTTLVDTHSQHNGVGFVLVEDARAIATALPRGRWRVRERVTPTLASRAHHFAVALRTLRIETERDDRNGPIENRLAAAYPLSIDGLNAAVALAIADLTSDSDNETRLRVFTTACRRVAASDVVRLVRRIEPVHRLTDIIVPDDRRVLLEEILANVRHGHTVLQKWGFGAQFPQGQGVAALFAGPSGTGKTMAAQAIARELDVDVFAVDLSRVVSKYIGETEKQLENVFSSAERHGGVLLFDEADALFGKRSEVKDAHDRYANLEVAFLLQRMESFAGLAILTTNTRQNLDPAFLRRLRFIVDFPRPDARARQLIWKKCLPTGAPVANDVNWRLLARFDLSGGVIRQITLRAAFMAAGAGHDVISMADLLAALRSELSKLGMQSAASELDEYEQLPVASRGVAA